MTHNSLHAHRLQLVENGDGMFSVDYCSVRCVSFLSFPFPVANRVWWLLPDVDWDYGRLVLNPMLLGRWTKRFLPIC